MVGTTRVLVLADALLQCRSDHGLTQREVAAEVGLSRTGVCNIERGLAQPRPTTRLRLLAFLKARGYQVEEAA